MKTKDIKRWGSSLRDVPWEGAFTPCERLIASTIQEWYDEKHRKSSKEEISYINSLKISGCPYCGSTEFSRCGHTSQGIQRYTCKSCSKRFLPLTNTIFDSKKIPLSEWIEYLMHLFEFHSITSSSRDNRNAEMTGKYWLLKVFEVLKGIQDDTILSGNVYIDETYFSVIKSDTVLKNGKKLRGISRNKIGVATGVDDDDHILIIVEYTSKPSKKSTWAAYGSHIATGSHLIHDGDNSHQILIDRLNLTEEIHPSEETKGLPDDDNPMAKINRIHYFMKRFMREHGGYDRNNLQDWMNLIFFILSEPDNVYDKIDKFFKIAVNSPARVKFRDVFCRKAHK